MANIFFIILAVLVPLINGSLEPLFSQVLSQSCGIFGGGPIVQKITPSSSYADGLYWDSESQQLLFVDRKGFSVNWYSPKTGYTLTLPVKHTKKEDLCALVPVSGTSYDYVLVTEKSLHLLYRYKSFSDMRILMAALNESDNAIFSTGNVSPNKQIWFGTQNKTFTHSDTETHNLYQINIAIDMTVVDSSLKTPHGVAWNQECTLVYVVDSQANCVYEYQFDIRTSKASNRVLILNMTDYNFTISGWVSGITCDTKGMLWLTLYGAGSVIQFNTRERLIINIISLPATDVVSLTFGGSNFDILFVGSSKYYLTNKNSQPEAGSIFAISGTGAQGWKANRIHVPDDLLSDKFYEPHNSPDSSTSEETSS